MRKIWLKIVAPNMGKIVARNMYFLFYLFGGLLGLFNKYLLSNRVIFFYLFLSASIII
jgi:hypothetical protein